MRVPLFASGTGVSGENGTYDAMPKESTDSFDVKFFRCPVCNRSTVEIQGLCGSIVNMHFVFPKGTYYPEYVPQQIKDDYAEAALIAELSPKASATLSRRCLQGILRDFWKITPEFWDSNIDLKREVRLKESSKANLWQEIKAVEQLGGVPAPIIAAFKQLKDIANIGAHPETDVNLIVDVEPGEAEALVSLVDLIIRLTYIQRNTDEELLRQVEGIASKKAGQRGGTK